MQTTASNDHERALIDAYTQVYSGDLYAALVQCHDLPRAQRLLQEGIERRRARMQGKAVEPLELIEKGAQ